MFYILIIFYSICSCFSADFAEDPYAGTNYKKIFHYRNYQEMARNFPDNENKRIAKMLSEINAEKRRVALKPLRNSIIEFSAKSACIWGLIRYSQAQVQLGIAFGILQATLMGFGLSGVAKHTLIYLDPERDYLRNYEELFVKHMDKIPPALWPKIVSVFEQSRDKKLEREQYEEFFDIALSLHGASCKKNLEKVLCRVNLRCR